MPFIVISILIQVAFVVHVVKTGRNTYWIWLVLMLPLAGSIAYLVVEVLPEMGRTRAARRAHTRFRKMVDPGGDINRAMDNLSRTESVENSMRLAEELLTEGMPADAKSLYERCLKGPHEHDPHIMLGLARARYALEDFAGAVETLDALREHNPEFRDANAHLLYAQATERSGDIEGALHEYEVLHGYFPGPEATFHYAVLLKSRGQEERARTLFEGIVSQAEISGRHYQSVHKDMIRQAKARLA